MNNEERREKILDTALSDLQFADDELGYADLAADGMIRVVNRMKKPELEELLEKAKESPYYQGDIDD